MLPLVLFSHDRNYKNCSAFSPTPNKILLVIWLWNYDSDPNTQQQINSKYLVLYSATCKLWNTESPWCLILGENRCVEYTAFWQVGMTDEEQLNEDRNNPSSVNSFFKKLSILCFSCSFNHYQHKWIFIC